MSRACYIQKYLSQVSHSSTWKWLTEGTVATQHNSLLYSKVRIASVVEPCVW